MVTGQLSIICWLHPLSSRTPRVNYGRVDEAVSGWKPLPEKSVKMVGWLARLSL